MNINELNRIRTINIEEKIANVEAGSGTYREILDKVMANEIIPIVSNSGMIVGISYDSKVDNLIDDNIAQIAFEKRYRGKDVMGYVLSALKLKANGSEIADVQEDASGIRVILTSGEVIVVAEYRTPVARPEPVALPESLDIPLEQFGTEEDVNIKAVKSYLRNKYDHYLSGDYADPDIELDAENGVIKITNIHWGRKR